MPVKGKQTMYSSSSSSSKKKKQVTKKVAAAVSGNVSSTKKTLRSSLKADDQSRHLALPVTTTKARSDQIMPPLPKGLVVLCGRGMAGIATKFPGNRLYRQLTLDMFGSYEAVSKNEKQSVSQRLVDEIHSRKGKFIYYDHSSNSYLELPNKKALDKASQSFRDLRPVFAKMGTTASSKPEVDITPPKQVLAKKTKTTNKTKAKNKTAVATKHSIAKSKGSVQSIGLTHPTPTVVSTRTRSGRLSIKILKAGNHTSTVPTPSKITASVNRDSELSSNVVGATTKSRAFVKRFKKTPTKIKAAESTMATKRTHSSTFKTNVASSTSKNKNKTVATTTQAGEIPAAVQASSKEQAHRSEQQDIDDSSRAVLQQDIANGFQPAPGLVFVPEEFLTLVRQYRTDASSCISKLPKPTDIIVCPCEANASAHLAKAHPGNLSFKAILDSYMPLSLTSTRSETYNLSETLVATIISLGGRWVELHASTNQWVELSSSKAIAYVVQAFKRRRPCESEFTNLTMLEPQNEVSPPSSSTIEEPQDEHTEFMDDTSKETQFKFEDLELDNVDPLKQIDFIPPPPEFIPTQSFAGVPKQPFFVSSMEEVLLLESYVG